MAHGLVDLLANLFIVLFIAQIGSEIAQRLKMPTVVGEIAIGCICGPSLLGIISLEHNEFLHNLSELGAILLLFSVGLETLLGDLKKVGFVAFLSGLIGVVFPLIVGTGWGIYQSYSLPVSLFIGSAFVATSAGITARVIQELNVMDKVESKVILGAAVIDDILAMLVLGVVTSMQGGGSVDTAGIVINTVKAIGFVFLVGFLGSRTMKRQWRFLDAPISPFSPLSLSLSLCLLLSLGATYVGLAPIIGAFLAGMIIAESPHRHSLHKQLEPIIVFIVPFFFVVSGAMVDLSQLASFESVMMVIVVTVLATLTKFIGCGAGALKLGKKSAAIIGIGMVPRGEVGIIIASLGKQMGLFSEQIFSVLIVMSLLTSVIAPPALGALFASQKDDEGSDTPKGDKVAATS